MSMQEQFRGVVQLKSPGFLLGGVRVHVSTWFDSPLSAALWADTVRETNLARPGRAGDSILATVQGRVKP